MDDDDASWRTAGRDSSTPTPLTVLKAAARDGWAAENRAAAQRFVACYELLKECERQCDADAGGECRPGHAVVDPYEVASGYVVSAMAISSLRAESMISFAWDLHTRYPAILSAMAAGRMEQRVAEMLARQMATVDPSVLPLVQQQVVDDYLAAVDAGVRLGAKAVRDNVDAIISRHDSEGIRLRREEASRARGVRVNKGIDGMSTVSATLATEEAAVLAEALDHRVAEHEAAEADAAAAAEAAGETAESGEGKCHYSKAERRADALMSLVCGDAGPAGSDPAAGGLPATLRPKVTVIAAGLGSDGSGAGSPEGARVEFTRTGEAALQALLDMLLTSDGASFEKVDPRIGAADDARNALKYRPSAELARRVRLRDGTCRHPGCAVPAEACDLDHVRPFDRADPERGGRTEECNLMCLCRRHHRFKTFSDWIYDLQPDGTLVVTTPEGSTMVTRPGGPLGDYRREQVRAEADAWVRQQRRSPDPATAGGADFSEPTYWARRAARLAAERARVEGAHAASASPQSGAGAGTGGYAGPAGQSRWWQRNQPVHSTVEEELEALIRDYLAELSDPPPF